MSEWQGASLRGVWLDEAMRLPIPPGITISTIYDGRRIEAVRYRCQACGEEWDDPDPHTTYSTSTHYDRQCKTHWASCPERGTP